MVRPQKVSVDVWKMVYGSCSYLALAFVAWVFLKLVNACFWLPAYLRDKPKQVTDSDLIENAEESQELLKRKDNKDATANDDEEDKESISSSSSTENEECKPDDKKNN